MGTDSKLMVLVFSIGVALIVGGITLIVRDAHESLQED